MPPTVPNLPLISYFHMGPELWLKDDFVRREFLALSQWGSEKLRACFSNCSYYASGKATPII